MNILTPDLTPYIGDETVALVHAAVKGVQWTAASSGRQSGTVTVRVVSVIAGLKIKADEIGIAGERDADPYVRAKDSANLWNVLKFQPGDQFLFALKPGAAAAGPKWTALAAWLAEGGASDPAIEGVRRCVEAQRVPAAKRLEYLPALVGSSDGLSRIYALTNLRNPSVATREQRAMIVARAFLKADANVRTHFAMEMTGRSYLIPEEGPEPANLAVIRALLQALVAETSRELRKEWVEHLAMAIGASLDKDPSKDAELRGRFAAAINDPPRAKAGAALRAEATVNPKDARIDKLAKAWGY